MIKSRWIITYRGIPVDRALTLWGACRKLSKLHATCRAYNVKYPGVIVRVP